MQDIGRISNPDEFSEAEALHPLQRGKKVFFYHASASPVAPHLMVHPIIRKTIDTLFDEGIIKAEELEAAKNPETLLKIISERVKTNIGIPNRAIDFLSVRLCKTLPQYFMREPYLLLVKEWDLILLELTFSYMHMKWIQL
mgnify:CR=1 FL=1